MEIVSEAVSMGVVEQRFDLKVGDEVVPGLHWFPEGVTAGHPTVLIGHGGTSHKRAPAVLGLARRLVRHLGYEAIALDAPDHGDRIKDAVAADAARKAIEQRIISGRRSGNPAGMAPEAAKAMAARAGKAVDEWKALLDDLGPGTYGYWGVSMGTLIGLPFVASEPRVQSAVLGLAGLFNRAPAFERAARQLTMPVLFLFQWDDELMSRESGLALFDAFGSKDKSMHINPGGHVGMPLTEHFAAEAFFVRTLGR